MIDRNLDPGLSRPPSPLQTPNPSPYESDDNENAAAEQPEQSQGAASKGRVRFQSVRRQSSSDSDPSHTPRGGTESPDQPERPLLPSSQSADLADVHWTEPSDTEHRRYSFDDEESNYGIGENEPVERSGSGKSRWKEAGQMLRQKTVRLTERLGRPPDEGEALTTSVIPDDLVGGVPLDDLDEKPKSHTESPPSHQPGNNAEAHRLVRSVTQNNARRRKPRGAYIRSGLSTPEGLSPDSNQGRGPRTRGGGILSHLLKLHSSQAGRKESASVTESSDSETQVSSGAATPKKEKLKWYKKPANHSTASLVGASMNLSRASLPQTADAWSAAQAKPKGKKQRNNTRLEDEIRVTVHIAEILARHRYIMQLCRALMRYGAPTHRLEEYMQMTARVLEVSGQFLYLPGCMIMSFDDPTTRTAEVKLVRMVQGVDLGRLADTHNVYKNVVHDLIGVEEASQELADIMSRKPRYNKWILVPMYGLASATVGPFAFSARPIDMPIIFVLGSLLGLMQHVLAPKSVLYSNVFEVTAAVLTSFLARAFGSIRDSHGNFMFCFSGIAQSSIALILPGFLVLCSSLELQSHQIIAGSIRMVYAIIYSLFLGYGITVGTTVYGLMDDQASSETKCAGMDVWGSEYAQRFPFVAVFALFLIIINQGKWKQTPVMIFIAVCGYVTNYFSTKKLGAQSEVANTVGAFTIGVLGNLYSRIWHGHAATAILPGIFVLVPSGLAASGSLMAGIEYANQVKENIAGPDNGSSTAISNTASLSSLGFGMVQVAIGITVGLFIAALVVYPYGKRRSGLFSF